MRISEILSWNNEPTEGNCPDHRLDLPAARFGNDQTNLANAFTRRGLVKSFWRLNGSEGQPYGPAPPDGTELIPSGTSEPGMASWPAEPVEAESPVVQHRLVPFRQ